MKRGNAEYKKLLTYTVLLYIMIMYSETVHWRCISEQRQKFAVDGNGLLCPLSFDGTGAWVCDHAEGRGDERRTGQTGGGNDVWSD